MHRHVPLTCLVIFALALTFNLPATAADRAVRGIASLDLENTALALPLEGTLRLEGLALEAEGPPAALELRRFRVFAPDARVVLHGPARDSYLPAPGNAYFRGRIDGRLESRAVISVLEAGGIRGLIFRHNRTWILGNARGAKGPADTLTVREIADTELIGKPFLCAADSLPEPPSQPAAAQVPAQPLGPTSYTARVAFETDDEYLALFGGNTTDATNYIGDLVAFGSTVYDDEASFNWVIPSVSLWPAGDPWTQTASGTLCMLLEFGRFWNVNDPMPGTPVRSNAQFLSGFASGGGIAWRPSICDPAFVYNHGGGCPGLTPQTDSYGGSYAYSGGIAGGFDINNPQSVWDIIVSMHENGHNMGSRHTHCYANIPDAGHPNPIDECYGSEAGCYSGPTSLPSGCPGPGNHCGTIMSYCHLQSGGLQNMALTLGAPAGGHPYGIEPERVPAAQNAYIAQQAAAFPGCLDRVTNDLIFENGFESGDTSGWSSTSS